MSGLKSHKKTIVYCIWKDNPLVVYVNVGLSALLCKWGDLPMETLRSMPVCHPCHWDPPSPGTPSPADATCRSKHFLWRCTWCGWTSASRRGIFWVAPFIVGLCGYRWKLLGDTGAVAHGTYNVKLTLQQWMSAEFTGAQFYRHLVLSRCIDRSGRLLDHV